MYSYSDHYTGLFFWESRPHVCLFMASDPSSRVVWITTVILSILTTGKALFLH